MTTDRDRAIRRVLWIEGGVNLAAVAAKLVVGTATGASVIVADAIHSATDLANNVLALVAVRVSANPPDQDHPYGHAKFETLAVFALAVLLAVLAVEVVLGAFRERSQLVTPSDWGLGLMLGLLGLHLATSLWEARRARELDSDVLRADARHTGSDALTTIAVIGSWQLAAAGYPMLDRIFTVGVALLIFALAYQLFRRAIPILVEAAAEDPSVLESVIGDVPGVLATRRVRSSPGGDGLRIDVVVGVDPELSTRESHAIADRVESTLADAFGARDITVHVEPEGHPANRDPGTSRTRS